MTTKRIAACLVSTFLLAAAAALAAGDTKPAAAKKAKGGAAAMAPDHAAMTPADMKWGAAPPSLPAGAQLAVLEGDPSKAGKAFTVRLKLPDGYKIPPHWHPTTEHVTVISGTFNIGAGDTVDQSKGTALGAGSFAYVGPKMHHYAWATGETEIQVHGIGPLVLNYVNPADDPQHGKK